MSSEHFGERMAMFWLDLVRYADTVGYHGDQDHHASPYRDYVIDAFNRNIPFDQFTREQIAGDLLPKSGVDQKIASCYNRLLQTSHEGGVQAKEYLAIYAADRVRNLSTVWMAATIGCAQCHDHKYDPYTQRDFYSLAAFFADVDEENHLRGGGTDTVPTRRSPEVVVLSRRDRDRIAWIENELQRNGEDDAQRTRLLAELASLNKSGRPVMVTRAVSPRPTRIFPRGNWLDESGELVVPSVPAFLGQLPEGPRRTRLDLANWLVDAKDGVGGLTARVFVNRIWALLFGVGLSNSLEDFGNQGEPPTHPELLDALALEFIESGWNVKQLIRRIATSRTYRQSSRWTDELRERDPENRRFARQSTFRLPAESIRDTALAVSGLLNREIGGVSSRPYQPAGYYRHLNFPKREYRADSDSRQWRRGVYVHWQRQFLHPMLRAFDASTREECTAQRPRSSTPLAALVLLNDPTFIESARGLAQRVLQSAETTETARIHQAFREATSRHPNEAEVKLLDSLLRSSLEEFRQDASAARKLLAIGIAPVPTGLPVAELAAWTTVCRTILNLNETVTRE